jgi:hypothetical protein
MFNFRWLPMPYGCLMIHNLCSSGHAFTCTSSLSATALLSLDVHATCAKDLLRESTCLQQILTSSVQRSRALQMISNLGVAITTFGGNPDYVTNFGETINGTEGVQAVNVVRARFPLNLYAAEAASSTIAEYYNVTAWCGPSWKVAQATANLALVKAAPFLAQSTPMPPHVHGSSEGGSAPLQAARVPSPRLLEAPAVDGRSVERTPGWAIALATVVSAGVQLLCMYLGECSGGADRNRGNHRAGHHWPVATVRMLAAAGPPLLLERLVSVHPEHAHPYSDNPFCCQLGEHGGVSSGLCQSPAWHVQCKRVAVKVSQSECCTFELNC